VFQIAKRVFLFITVNLLIMVTISIVLNVLGVQPYLDEQGINFGALATFCLVWGFGGAFISLALSRVMAKFMMGVKVIDPKTNNPEMRWLVDTVYDLARAARLSKMPEVGIYESPEVNAFATGPTRSRALVATSSGLLRQMGKNEVRGVLGHEIAHVANGDMVTMTLLQGLVNAFVMFFARILAFVLSQNVDENRRYMVRWISTIVFEILLSFLGFMVVAAFSRRREYRADAGGSRLAGRENMISALQALGAIHAPVVEARGEALANLKISGRRRSGMALLMSTHPPIEERIRRLQRS
jgi:heat shock protein HtpX